MSTGSPAQSSRLDPDATAPPAQTTVAAGVVFLMYLGLMILNPLIAPLARELGLAEWQIGAVVSVASLVMVVASPRWGRLGGSWGRRRVLLLATVSGTIAIALFALLTQLGLHGLITPIALFLAFLLVRGVWFGLSEAAVLPNVQAYVAETTPDPDARLKGMSAVGAAQGLSMVIGSAAGGLLAALGTAVPLWTTPVLLAAAVALIALRFREPALRSRQRTAGTAVRLLDRRTLPFLAIAFGTFTALRFMQMLIGFLIQDRLGIGTEQTALLTGVTLLGAGAGLFLAQAIIVPRSGWRPARLIRLGLWVAAAGFLLLLPDGGFWALFAGVVLTGVGIGMVSPSISAGASLAVGDDEQGSIAGLVGAASALTFVVAPLAATTLYAIDPAVPLAIAAAVCIGALALAWTARRIDTPPRSDEDRGRRPG